MWSAQVASLLALCIFHSIATPVEEPVQRLLSAGALPQISSTNYSGCPYAGLDFGTSYATAVVRYVDGTTRSFRAETSSEYLETMQRLSSPSSKHIHPPYHNIFEKIADQPRQWMRRASEQLLQHASSDVAQIHRLIRALREEIERGYVPRIIPVVVTRPRILALYDEDINDALKFNGLLEKEPDLESVQAAKGCPMPGHSTAVAWGSSGRYARSKDQETILSVLYTRKALQVQRGTLSSNNLCDWEASEREDNSILSWELGSEALERLESQEYWARVRALLLELPARPSLGEDPIARVVLHGESANLTDFVEVVKNTVTQLPQDKDPTVICDDPMFTAARGAMTLAIQQRTECLSEPS